MITKQDLINAGFHEYKTGPYDAQKHIVERWQLCVRYEGGKKYFIDAKGIDFGPGDELHPDLAGIKYELWTQVYTKGSHNAQNITFIGQTIDEAKDFIETLFNKEIIEPYE